MQDFIIVATFVFPSEMAVAKGKLESEGIECRVLDELTVQSNNFFSNAVGGVKLQVHQSEYEKAQSILLEGGFLTETGTEPSYIEKTLGNPTSIKKIKIGLYILLSFVLLSFVVVAFFVKQNALTIQEQMLIEDWYLETVIYGDRQFTPNTYNPQSTSIFTDSVPVFSFDIYKIEKISFNQDGTLQLPGFDSPEIYGEWHFSGDRLTISTTDDLDYIFENTYEIQLNTKRLTLVSGGTSIICYAL